MVALTMVRSEAEAEVLCGMLRVNGIACGYQQTNVGAGAADGFSRGGALEIFVAEGDAQRAQELLRS
jgi:putative signal transducing protein